jgi:hypothetical protein
MGNQWVWCISEWIILYFFHSHSDFDLYLVLHPGLKLEYFRQQDWDEEWISNAGDLVRDEYIINYKGKEGLKATDPVVSY